MAKNDLQSLKELAQVVTRNKAKSIDTLSKKGPETKIWDLYDGILKESFATDEEAAEHIYSKDMHYPEYRKLKNKLKEKLINTAFFIDINNPKFNTHQKAYYTCQKNLVAIKTLLGRYARTPAIELAESTLKKSIRFEFSEISYELTKILRSHYAIIENRRTLYNKYAELSNYYCKLVSAEDSVAEKYDHISALSHRVKSQDIVINFCSQYEKELEPLVKKYDSYRLHLLYYFIGLKKLTLKGDPHLLIGLCEQAITFLSSKGFVSDQFIGAFYYNKLMASIQIRDLASANDLANKCSSIFEENTIRWYNAQEICFVFAMQLCQYRKASTIRDKVVNSPSFNNQLQNRSETWKLYDAYLHYLHLSKRISNKNIKVSIFRIRKFLNEVPVHSMDKSGRNIPIILIQILIQIQQKKYDQLTDKIEAIEKYTTRYLRKDNNYRSNCFIKMLLQIPKQQFHPVAVRRHTKTLLTKLKSMPLEKAKQPFEIEIIPYEDLWEMALESIG